jgi:hypothetical protein
MKRLFLLFWLPALHAMQVGSPATPKKPLSPQEVATAVTMKLFDKPDQEIISVFSRIITRDPKGNTALLELRYRMLSRLEEERYLCGDTQ